MANTINLNQTYTLNHATHQNKYSNIWNIPAISQNVSTFYISSCLSSLSLTDCGLESGLINKSVLYMGNAKKILYPSVEDSARNTVNIRRGTNTRIGLIANW